MPRDYVCRWKKCCFKVYCAQPDQAQLIFNHILAQKTKTIKCLIVSPPDQGDDGEPKVSHSAAQTPNSWSGRTNILCQEDLKKDEEDEDDDSKEDVDDSDFSDPDSDAGVFGDDQQGEEVVESFDDLLAEALAKRTAPYPYRVYIEFEEAPNWGRKWGIGLMDGFNPQQCVHASIPFAVNQCEGKDMYIVNLLDPARVPKPVVRGTPTLDEKHTQQLVERKYHKAEEEAKVEKEIAALCCARKGTTTHRRILKLWRAIKNVPSTPKTVICRYTDVVEPKLINNFDFRPMARPDAWAAEWVGKPLDRSRYKPLVLMSGLGRIGKTWWARHLGPHIRNTGSLNLEKIQAGLSSGKAQLLILDNPSWQELFDSHLGRALAEGQDEVDVRMPNNTRITLKLGLPVIICNNKKPTTWGRHHKKAYWMEALIWKRLPNDKKLYLEASAPVPDQVLATAPPVPDQVHQVSAPAPPVLDHLRPRVDVDLSDLTTVWPTAERLEHGGELLGWYLPDFLSSEVADLMLAGLRDELRPHYLARGDLEVAMRIFGEPKAVTRDKAVFSCAEGNWRDLYRYNSPEYSQATPFKEAPIVLSIRDLIAERIRILTTHCVANAYQRQKSKKAGDKITEHSDDDTDFLLGSPIVTVTLCEEGAAREVTFRKYGHKGEVQGTLSQKTGKEVPVKSLITTASAFTPQHGSLYIILYDANHVKDDEARSVWKHGVEPGAGKCGVRYGLTYRCISTLWDVTSGRLENGEQALPVNIVDRNFHRVQYDGPRWGATNTAVMEYPEAVAYAATCARKVEEKRKKAEAAHEKKLAKVDAQVEKKPPAKTARRAKRKVEETEEDDEEPSKEQKVE